jgi:hypothetical protein
MPRLSQYVASEGSIHRPLASEKSQRGPNEITADAAGQLSEQQIVLQQEIKVLQNRYAKRYGPGQDQRQAVMSFGLSPAVPYPLLGKLLP